MAALNRVEFDLQDELGNLYTAGTQIRWTNEADATLPQLYSDYANATALGNPFVVAQGVSHIAFYSPPGRYKLEYLVDAVWTTLRRDFHVGTARGADFGDILAVGLPHVSQDHMCALLDPAAYYSFQGLSTSPMTVPADTTWYLLEAWGIEIDGAEVYNRSPSIDNAIPVKEGTVIEFNRSVSRIYACKPELVTPPDDPEATIIRRLNLLKTMPLYGLNVSDPGGGNPGDWPADVLFPSDFTTGFLRWTSIYDAAYILTVGLYDGHNLVPELSDTHPWRFAHRTMLPFTRGNGQHQINGINAAKASWTGVAGSSLEMRCSVLYHKLDGTGW